MCGIFGIISNELIDNDDFKLLAMHARQRGKDSSGIISFNQNDQSYNINKADTDIKDLLLSVPKYSNILMGHSRLITNGHE